MHKKTTLFFSISLILALSILSNVNVQSASAQDTANVPDVYMVGLQLQLKQLDKNYFSPVNVSMLPLVQNQTEAKFIASFVNQNSSSATLQSFQVIFFNSSENRVPENILTLTYDQNSPARIQIPVNGSYTEVYQQQIPFKLLQDEAYTVQYEFQYVLASNTSLSLTLKSPFNFSLESQLPLYSPPDFIIWAWWGINGAILVQFLIGWYGNRKTKKQNNT